MRERERGRETACEEATREPNSNPKEMQSRERRERKTRIGKNNNADDLADLMSNVRVKEEGMREKRMNKRQMKERTKGLLSGN